MSSIFYQTTNYLWRGSVWTGDLLVLSTHRVSVKLACSPQRHILRHGSCSLRSWTARLPRRVLSGRKFLSSVLRRVRLGAENPASQSDREKHSFPPPSLRRPYAAARPRPVDEVRIMRVVCRVVETRRAKPPTTRQRSAVKISMVTLEL